MPIKVTCPQCEADYKVPDNLVGKSIRCKACQASIPVRDPDEPGDDEPEVAAPVRRKKKKKKKAGTEPWLIAVAVLFGVFFLVFLGWFGWKVNRVANEPFANVPNVPNAPKFDPNNAAAPIRPMPNNGQAITDPDQLINGKYPAGKDRFTIDSPQKTGNRLEFGYTILAKEGETPAQRDMGRFGNGRRSIIMTERVTIVSASEGQIRESALHSIRWEEQGRITLSAFGANALPSGTRVCLVIGGQRVSNVLIVP